MMTIILLIDIGAWATIVFLFLLTDSWFPFDFLYQKICQGSNFEADSEEKSFKNMLINNVLRSLVLVYCLSNHYRVNRFKKMHGRSYFLHRRQNILTFGQTCVACYTGIIIYIISMFLQQYINLFESQETYRWVNQCYKYVATLYLTTGLPLIWLVSIWNNFPEFWSTFNIYTFETSIAPTIYIVTQTYKRELVPRGPYVCQHDTKAKSNFSSERSSLFSASCNAYFFDIKTNKNLEDNLATRPKTLQKSVRGKNKQGYLKKKGNVSKSPNTEYFLNPRIFYHGPDFHSVGLPSPAIHVTQHF